MKRRRVADVEAENPNGCETLANLSPGAVAAPTRYGELMTVRYDVLITSLTPIVHSSGTVGNEALLMTERVVDPDDPQGLPQDVPCLTGNSLRHALREALAHLTLRTLDLELGSLPVAAQHFLLSGGSLGRQAETLDVAGYRRALELFPYLGLFGGGLGSLLIPGKLQVAYAILLCAQNAWRVRLLCPPLTELAGDLQPAEEYRERRQATRHDARRGLLARHALRPEDRDAWEQSLSSEEGATDSNQMIFAYEAVCAGARWLWQVGGVLMTPLEHSALVCALLALGARGQLGAKGATGHGAVALRAVHASGETSSLAEGLRALDQDARIEATARQFAGPYLDHVVMNRTDLLAWLTAIR